MFLLFSINDITIAAFEHSTNYSKDHIKSARTLA
jgi:hypothetical protein